MGRPKAPRPGMPTWLPPAFTAPCRKSQADATLRGNGCAVPDPSKNRVHCRLRPINNVAEITCLCMDASPPIKVDLNADVGESFGPYVLGQDTALMPLITSANIACGFHAGDPHVMRKTVQLALEHGVAIGAHPGFPDLAGFGRRPVPLSPAEVEDVVIYQVGALSGMVR